MFNNSTQSDFKNPFNNNPEDKQNFFLKKTVKYFFAFIVLSLLVYSLSYSFVTGLNKPPEFFPVNQAIIVEEGTGVRKMTEMLKSASVVKSSDLLYYIISFFHESTNIKASTYIFDKPLTSWEVAIRLTEGDFDTDLIRFTHFEGERVTLVGGRASEILLNFDTKMFISKATPFEGKLYPDTYFIPDDYTYDELLDLMLDTFDSKTASLTADFDEHFLSLDEILVLASIIEREANSEISMKMVSSVLQNRMKINMPLQADASIEYILDKPLSELTPDDLKIDSPYNTYLNTGLPPTPIGNPGLIAIQAVLNPSDTEFLFYITGEDGEFYYAKNYSTHLRNIDKYLR